MAALAGKRKPVICFLILGKMTNDSGLSDFLFFFGYIDPFVKSVYFRGKKFLERFYIYIYVYINNIIRK